MLELSMADFLHLRYPVMIVVIATIVLLVLALGVGIALNTRVRPFAKSEVQGVKLELLVSPLLTLTALLLAFVLVQVFSSFNRARLSAGDEAGKVAGEFILFGFLPSEYSVPGQSALVCYARSVAEIEWPQLRHELKVVREPVLWAEQVGDVLEMLAERHNAQPFGTLVATERDRMDARRRRIAETRPAVPRAVSWLMLSVSVVAIFSLATFTLPYVARRVQIGALALLAAVFASVQIAIFEIDDKYEGVIRVEPDEMRLVAQMMAQRLASADPGQPLPCDERGQPLP